MIDISNITEAGHKGWDLATFSWFLTNVCQYRCKYCSVAKMLQKTADTKYLYVYKNILKRLALKKSMPFIIEVQGGEPTLHPDIHIILRELNKNEKCQKVELITNLVKSVRFFQQFDHNDCSKLEIVPSYHPEYDKADAYVNKLIELNNFDHIKLCPNINLVDDKRYWDQTITVMNQLKDNDISFGTNMLHSSINGNWDPKYPEEFNDKFSEYISSPLAGSCKIPYVAANGDQHEFAEHEIYSHNLQRFKGFFCTPLHWCISPAGEISNSCTNEQLHPLALNAKSRVKCPVANGCLECEKYSYYKNRDE